MQPFAWYLRRLRSMSIEEVAWRAPSVARNTTDRMRLALGVVPTPRLVLLPNGDGVGAPGFRVSDSPVGVWSRLEPEAPEARWCERLVSQAELLLQNRLNLFNVRDRFLGDP